MLDDKDTFETFADATVAKWNRWVQFVLEGSYPALQHLTTRQRYAFIKKIFIQNFGVIDRYLDEVRNARR